VVLGEFEAGRYAGLKANDAISVQGARDPTLRRSQTPPSPSIAHSAHSRQGRTIF